MFKGSHTVLVSEHGLPTVINTTSLEYPEMIATGKYTVATDELLSKKDAESLKEELLGEFPGENE